MFILAYLFCSRFTRRYINLFNTHSIIAPIILSNLKCLLLCRLIKYCAEHQKTDVSKDVMFKVFKKRTLLDANFGINFRSWSLESILLKTRSRRTRHAICSNIRFKWIYKIFTCQSPKWSCLVFFFCSWFSSQLIFVTLMSNAMVECSFCQCAVKLCCSLYMRLAVLKKKVQCLERSRVRAGNIFWWRKKLPYSWRFFSFVDAPPRLHIGWTTDMKSRWQEATHFTE